MRRTIFDIETDGLLDEVQNLWCIVCRDADTGEVTTYGPDKVHEGVQHLIDSDELIGHNIINYDVPALAKLGYRIDSFPKLTDTLVLSRLMHTNLGDSDRIRNLKGEVIPPRLIGSHSLKAWGYRLECHKGNYIEEHGYDHYSEGMLVYCVQDTEVTYRLYRDLIAEGWSQQCIDLEHRFATIINDMSNHGFSFDVYKARDLYVRLSCRKLELQEQLKVMFPDDKQQMKSTLWRTSDGDLYETKKSAKAAGFKDAEIEKGPAKIKLIPFNAGSRDHIADRLQRLGWKPVEMTNEGKPKVDETILSKVRLEKGQESVELLNEYLTLVKRMGQLAEGKQAWMKLEQKGRIHGKVNTNGAVTGRCTHSNPNVAQVPRCGSPYGTDCRELFKASEGYTLIGCDAAGLELRCLAHFLAPYDEGDYTKKLLESDIHVENQKAAGLPTRDAAKRFIYAFLYGAGDAKIGEVIGKGRAAGRSIKETFLSSLPALAKLKACITSALADRDFLKGLDGRHLYIRSEHSALNTLLQSAGAVIMKQATVELYDSLTKLGLKHGSDWAFVAHVHDEFQMEVRPQHTEVVRAAAVEAIKQAGITLQFRCPLDGEARAGKNWAETH
jgi:DNA polymerase I-like protein with 3'-5' exonuclease and polymerase domains